MKYKISQAYLYKTENVRVVYHGDYSGFLGFTRDDQSWVYLWGEDARIEIGPWVEPEPAPEPEVPLEDPEVI